MAPPANMARRMSCRGRNHLPAAVVWDTSDFDETYAIGLPPVSSGSRIAQPNRSSPNRLLAAALGAIQPETFGKHQSEKPARGTDPQFQRLRPHRAYRRGRQELASTGISLKGVFLRASPTMRKTPPQARRALYHKTLGDAAMF